MDEETAELLRGFKALPDLLTMAKAMEGDVYENQDRLRQQHIERNQVYRYSTPYRHLVTCEKCGRSEGEVKYTLGLPSAGIAGRLGMARPIEIFRKDIHDIEEHDGRFPDDVARFLRLHVLGGPPR